MALFALNVHALRVELVPKPKKGVYTVNVRLDGYHKASSKEIFQAMDQCIVELSKLIALLPYGTWGNLGGCGVKGGHVDPRESGYDRFTYDWVSGSIEITDEVINRKMAVKFYDVCEAYFAPHADAEKVEEICTGYFDPDFLNLGT